MKFLFLLSMIATASAQYLGQGRISSRPMSMGRAQFGGVVGGYGQGIPSRGTPSMGVRAGVHAPMGRGMSRGRGMGGIVPSVAADFDFEAARAEADALLDEAQAMYESAQAAQTEGLAQGEALNLELADFQAKLSAQQEEIRLDIQGQQEKLFADLEADLAAKQADIAAKKGPLQDEIEATRLTLEQLQAELQALQAGEANLAQSAVEKRQMIMASTQQAQQQQQANYQAGLAELQAQRQGAQQARTLAQSEFKSIQNTIQNARDTRTRTIERLAVQEAILKHDEISAALQEASAAGEPTQSFQAEISALMRVPGFSDHMQAKSEQKRRQQEREAATAKAKARSGMRGGFQHFG